MTKDISEMQPDELAKHIEEAQKILQKKKDDELAKLAADISAAIKKSNFSLEEVLEQLGVAPSLGKSNKADSNKKGKVYVNPNNQSETWGGAGRVPGWLVSYLEDVKEIKFDKFSIKHPLIAPELAKLEKK
ncbi:H-NS family nucleoid-associated regulatory protein [Aliiroseovarius marinus]|uniref:H-NS histone family protein n=1 Tax=Aliiroseovarius marinus TaxID=2500159 RepID=UPI0010622229|nr:H-NS histone family protein [Aliiroseovarius marinus]